LRGCNFKGSNLVSVRFHDSRLEGVNFSGLTITEASIQNSSCAGALFVGSNLSGSSFKGNTNCFSCDFANANLEKVRFQEAQLNSSIFSHANLDNANLIFADLEAANFEDAILENASLYRANFSSANLERANIRNAEITDANFSDANLDGIVSGELRGVPEFLPERFQLWNGFIIKKGDDVKITITVSYGADATKEVDSVNLNTSVQELPLPTLLVDEKLQVEFPRIVSSKLSVSKDKPSEANKGVDVSDILVLRKHILLMELLDDPLNLIAADVNRDNYIDVSDIVSMRKVILSMTDLSFMQAWVKVQPSLPGTMRCSRESQRTALSPC